MGFFNLPNTINSFFTANCKAYITNELQEKINIKDDFQNLDFKFFFYKSATEETWHWSAWKDPLLFSISNIIGGIMLDYCLLESDGRQYFIEKGEPNTHARLRGYLPNCIAIFPISGYLFLLIYSGVIMAIRTTFSQIQLTDYFYILMLNFSLCIFCYGSIYPVFSLPVESWNHLKFFLFCGYSYFLAIGFWILSTIFLMIFGSYLFSQKWIILYCFIFFMIIHILVLILQFIYMNPVFAKDMKFISEEKNLNLKNQESENKQISYSQENFEQDQFLLPSQQNNINLDTSIQDYNHNLIQQSQPIKQQENQSNIELQQFSNDFNFSLYSQIDNSNNN